MSGEPQARIQAVETLYKGWATLKNVRFELLRRSGQRQPQAHLAFDIGDGAAVLPYDPERRTVLLVRQFRVCAQLASGHGALIEACAGKLDADDPETCARREAEEELGYRLGALEKVCEAYSSPGALVERLTLFLAAYGPTDRVSDGGGKAGDGEEIEVLELPFADTLAMLAGGEIIDLKTVTLLQSLALSGRMAR